MNEDEILQSIHSRFAAKYGPELTRFAGLLMAIRQMNGKIRQAMGDEESHMFSFITGDLFASACMDKYDGDLITQVANEFTAALIAASEVEESAASVIAKAQRGFTEKAFICVLAASALALLAAGFLLGYYAGA